MKILLANLPWVNDGTYVGIRAGSRWPHLRRRDESLPYFPFPFSLAYTAAVLKEAGHEVLLKDCIAEEITHSAFRALAASFHPQMAIAETSTPSIENDLALTRSVKEATGAVTVLCGQHATAMADSLLQQPFVDYCLLGEYEYVARELAAHLSEGKDASCLLGVCCRRRGTVVMNERAPLIGDLDSLPLPLREALPMHKYVDGFCKHVPNTQMVTSRGCPYQCIFCLEPSVYYGGPSYRTRSPESVVDEMSLLRDAYRAREIYFDDSSFSVDQERVRTICRLIRSRRLRLWWSCMADAHLSEETLRAMKQAQCIGIKFGVESADPTVLRNIRKHVNLQQVRELVKNCKRIGIATHATYAFGLPGETRESLQRTIDFAFSLPTDTAQFSVAIPYPGTAFYERARKEGWLVAAAWSDYNGQTVTVVEYPQLKKKDIIEALRYCRRRVIIKTIAQPRLLFSYLAWLKTYVGWGGLIRDIGKKVRYLLGP